MKLFLLTTILLFSINNYAQIIYEGIGYDEIRLGQTKKSLLKNSDAKFKKTKINEFVYLENQDFILGLDEDNLIDEIIIYPNTTLKTNTGKIIIPNQSVGEIIKSFGEEWSYYGKNPVNISYDNGISFETEFILNENDLPNLSVNQYFLNSEIVSVIITEPDKLPDNYYSNLEFIEGVYIPINLEDSFNQLEKILKRKDKNEFLKRTEDEFLSSTHFGLGKYLRNEWGLWRKSRLYEYFSEQGLYHPDDISTVILKYYYRKKNKLEFNLQKEIIFYIEYWKSN